ncbi:MAG: 4-hydroxy-tetrahydrodipicolinate synthase [Candidatus Omnitrophica bacterium]|nr:4-hydroxy-tetrahydrodipicolinate synthase [Candidatus Omnitrophota bacterium]MDE2221987.1 4-hydroxy-tetrahydrodipicolinate synthase [Candidatus Omnitrophota bacterium]
MDRKRFHGAFTALITPFTANGIDEAAYKKLIEWQIAQGIHGLVPCGTTGESPTLSEKEHEQVIELCVKTAAQRVPVIAGTGSNSTREAVNMTQHAAKIGADAALVVTPYYNKPTAKGIYLHYKAISESADIPIILYNIAGRTARNIEPELMAKLASLKNIIGVKEASGNQEQMKKIREVCPKDFLLLSGDDALTLAILNMGGVGIISVASNIVPQDVAGLVNAFNDGDKQKAAVLNAKLLPLIDALFIETNPIPVKTAAALMGFCSDQMRLPMCAMEEVNLVQLKQALKVYGLIK